MAKTPKISADERRWRAEDALRTITRANEIQGDRRLMADVKKIAQAQVKTLTKVAGPTTRKPAARKK